VFNEGVDYQMTVLFGNLTVPVCGLAQHRIQIHVEEHEATRKSRQWQKWCRVGGSRDV
jgi:hypothetical protein